MRRLVVALSALVLTAALPGAQQTAAKPLQIWVVDVEGGKAALYVTPTGQTAIIDTGFPGARDLDRIMAAIADAGVKQIDFLISSHYHVDHIGNLVELAKRIPVGTFVDHGPTVEGPDVPQVAPGADGLPVTKPREQIEGFQAAYAELYGKAKHLVVKPGDRVPIGGVDWRIAAAGGKLLKTPPLPGGGGANPFCANFTPMAGTTGLVDPDDAQSIGNVIILGQFRAVDFGDMWRTKELELMCPTNPIGTVDLYFATSHGAVASGSLPFVQRPARAEQPRPVHREYRGHADDRRSADGSAPRRGSGRHARSGARCRGTSAHDRSCCPGRDNAATRDSTDRGCPAGGRGSGARTWSRQRGRPHAGVLAQGRRVRGR
jgi:beta-lactamase superfamily II metal-dependent hydrolase